MGKTACIIIFVIGSFGLSSAQHKNSFSVRSSDLDSLILLGELQQVRTILHDDSLSARITPDKISAVQDSVRRRYTSFLARIEREFVLSDDEKIDLMQTIEMTPERFQAKDAGVHAFAAYTKSRSNKAGNDTIGAIRCFVMAEFFKVNHIIGDENRLLGNLSRLDSLLRISARSISASQQERTHGREFGEMDEAQQLVDLYRTEDRRTPAFRAVAAALTPEYERLELDLRHQQSLREEEENSEFKKVRYAISIGGGAAIFTDEQFPPFHLTSDYSSSYKYESDEPQGKTTFIGYLISAGASYFVRDNLMVEASYTRAKAERSRPKYIPFAGDPYVVPGYSHPMTYSTVSMVGTYLWRIKTGVRTLAGLGFSYTGFDAPAALQLIYRSVEISSPPQHGSAYRCVIRSGFEFLPGRGSFLSYSLLFDCHITLSSTEKISPLTIYPYFRAAWLL